MSIWSIDKNGKYIETSAVSFIFAVEDNTATNNHTTNAMLIAKNYGTLQEKLIIEELVAIHDFAGSLNKYEIMARDYIIQNIVDRIKPKKFREEIQRRL